MYRLRRRSRSYRRRRTRSYRRRRSYRRVSSKRRRGRPSLPKSLGRMYRMPAGPRRSRRGRPSKRRSPSKKRSKRRGRKPKVYKLTANRPRGRPAPLSVGRVYRNPIGPARRRGRPSKRRSPSKKRSSRRGRGRGRSAGITMRALFATPKRSRRGRPRKSSRRRLRRRSLW